MENIGSGLRSRIETLEKSIGYAFTVPSFEANSAEDKYDGVPGIILRATDITEPSEQDFFTYVQQDIRKLQGIFGAKTLVRAAISSQIDKIISR